MLTAPTGLLLFFIGYFLLAFVWRSWVVHRQTGRSPLVLPGADSAFGYVGRAFKVSLGFLLIFLTLHAIWPETVLQHGGIYQAPALARSIGWLLLCLSALGMLIAQAQMGSSWRVGIDTQHRTALVTQGLFTRSRNPIFLSVRMSLLGLFFIVPHAASLTLLVAGELLVQIQVRLEEQHLIEQHSLAYERYKARVRRWI